ncbi:MAG: hypothetical protein HY711_10865 [Candidatus Melainabacteria bacterium]|nr:hypothetical protein [Candidatus Melainabacteria bacterium]
MFFLAAVEHSNPIFGLFENNLINWAFLIIIIIWLGSKFLPAAFRSRQTTIERALKEASQAREEGLAFLEVQKQKILSAEQDAENILIEAKQVAQQMKQQMEAQTQKELADIQLRISQEIAQERQLTLQQLRAQVARAAVRLTELTLPSHVTHSTNQKLLDDFLGELEAIYHAK